MKKLVFLFAFIVFASCEKDEECYVAVKDSKMFPTAAVTDAEKAKRCCAYMGDVKMPATLL